MNIESLSIVINGVEERFVQAVALAEKAIETAKQTAVKPPKIGEFWHEEGGVYAGLMRGENGQSDCHLIIPTAPEAYVEEIKWGGYGKDESGANSSFDGLANTTALNESEIKHPAAQWAAALVIDGRSDFYLPSRRELRLAWVNVPELFVDGWYWSSTQYSADTAFCQDFGDGGQHYGHKTNEFRARAVRRVMVDC